MKTVTLETINDTEFGLVHIRRMQQAKFVRLRVKNNGALHITLPYRAALWHAKELLNRSRAHIRRVQQTQATTHHWRDGQTIGNVYKLRIVADTEVQGVITKIESTQAIVRHHPTVNETMLQTTVQTFVEKLLRKQAMAYLPRRLKALATTHKFSYQRVRFSSAETRWGSCSSAGTISLNIQLMTLPPALIEYVLIHELCHTRYMNHSRAFWQAVEQCLPEYQSCRKAIKQYSTRGGN